MEPLAWKSRPYAAHLRAALQHFGSLTPLCQELEVADLLYSVVLVVVVEEVETMHSNPQLRRGDLHVVAPLMAKLQQFLVKEGYWLWVRVLTTKVYSQVQVHSK